jgi:hypothetical protein
LQFAFITSLLDRWSRVRCAALAAYSALLAAFSLAWLRVHLTLGARFPTQAYGQYRGGAHAVLAMDLTGSLCTIVAGLLCAGVYAPFLGQRQRLDERLGAAGAIAVSIGVVAYGALTLAQTLASSAGGQGIGLFALRVPIILVGAAVAPLTVWLVTYLQPLFWQLWTPAWGTAGARVLQQRETQLRQQEEALFRLRLDLLDAQTLLDDAAARLQHFADPVVIDAVASRCAKRDLPPYEQRVTIEAAIWATAMRGQAGWTP